VERGRNFPPLAEILAGTPLNNLLDELIKHPALPATDSTPVEAEWLAHAHVTVDGRGNIGLLKSDRIFWPQLLLRTDFASEREKIDQCLARAKTQALLSASHPESNMDVLRELRQRVASCRERITNELRSGADDPAWNMRHYVEAKRILNQLD